MNLYEIRHSLANTLCVKEDSPLMEQLFTQYVTPQELLNATTEELQLIKGIGKVKAFQITSCLKLARSLNTPRVEQYVIRKPEDAFHLLRYEIGHLQHEECWIIMLNTKNGVIAKQLISIGSLNAAIVAPREVFKRAILRSSCSIIIAHNHPSQDNTPSNQDIQITKRIKECGEILGIELLDSVIVTTHTYCSLKEQGLM